MNYHLHQNIDNANDIELENIADSVQNSIEDLIHISKEIQTDDLFELNPYESY